jgi:palmitoyl-protein thioesterase
MFLSLSLFFTLLDVTLSVRPNVGLVDLKAPAGGLDLPVVMWHGMGDSCCEPLRSVGALKKMIEDKLGVYVLSIATGSTEAKDVWSSYFGDVNEQAAAVCEQLRSTPELQGGFNAIGFSQGGQFMRAVIQRCQHIGPKANLLITLGSQHQGVMNAPGCESTAPSSLAASTSAVQDAGSFSTACQAMQALLARGAYLPLVQNHVVQAQYFKDPFHMDEYLKKSIFLADLNNEHQCKSMQYKENLLTLNKFVMYRFTAEKMVVPRDSSWFSWFNGTHLVPLVEQPLYLEDWLGLKELDDSGRLVFAEVEGEHMQFSFDWFEAEIIDKYFRTSSSASTSA